MKENKNRFACGIRRRAGRRVVCTVLAAILAVFSLNSCSSGMKSEPAQVMKMVPMTDQNSHSVEAGLDLCSLYNEYSLCDDEYKNKSDFEFSGTDEYISGEHQLYIGSKFKFNLSMNGEVKLRIAEFSEKTGISEDDFIIEKTGEEGNIYRITGNFTYEDKEMYLECLMQNRENDIGCMIETAPVQDREQVSYRLNEMFKTYNFGRYPSFVPEGGYPVKVRTDFASAVVPDGINVSFLDSNALYSDGEYIIDTDKLSFEIADTDNYNVAYYTSLDILNSEMSGNKTAEKESDSQLRRYKLEEITTDEYGVSKAGELWPDCDPDIRNLPVYYFNVYSDDKVRVCTEYYFNIGSDLIKVFFYHTTDAEKYEDEVEKVRSMINNVDFFT